jgi:hypothetical protein
MNRYQQKIDELILAERDLAMGSIRPASESDLAEVEKTLGHVLPPDYRGFLRDFGGLSLPSNECRRAALYHLTDSTFGRASLGRCYDWRELLEVAANQPWILPPELTEIAEDGNVRLFLAVTGEHAGCVYQWYPTDFPERLYYYPELELVSRSFDEFIYSLKPLKDEFYNDPVHYETENREISAVIETLEKIELPAKNACSNVMSALKGRYVYATIGEDAPSLTEEHLREIEEKVGYVLPQDYREFLRSFGGYCFLPQQVEERYSPAPARFPFSDGDTTDGVHATLTFFHGIMTNDFHDLLTHHERLQGYLPPGFLPIADAGQVCLKLIEPQAGAVFLAYGDIKEFSLDESYCAPIAAVGEESLMFVAPSFDEFIRSFKLERNL